MSYGESLKRFLVGVAKISAALLITVLMLTVGFWAITSHNETKERRARAPLAIPKKFETLSLHSLDGVRADLATVWRDGNIYYRLSLAGDSPRLSASRFSAEAAFGIRLLDAHGFELHKQEAPVATLTRITSSEGTPSGYEWQGNEPLQESVYRSTASWRLLWQGLSDPAYQVQDLDQLRGRPEQRSPTPQPSTAPWKQKSRWRQLSIGMSKESVESLLGSAGKVDTFPGGSSWWWYGYPSGGRVVFSPSGTVESWSEP